MPCRGMLCLVVSADHVNAERDERSTRGGGFGCRVRAGQTPMIAAGGEVVKFGSAFPPLVAILPRPGAGKVVVESA